MITESKLLDRKILRHGPPPPATPCGGGGGGGGAGGGAPPPRPGARQGAGCRCEGLEGLWSGCCAHSSSALQGCPGGFLALVGNVEPGARYAS